MNTHLTVPGRADAPVVLTCEHAVETLPEPWSWPDADRRLLGTHWSHDIGIADLTREVAALAKWPATLAAFSRLLVDPNRAPEQENLFRAEADGLPIVFNADLSASERARRLAFHAGYHDACDAMVAATPEALVFSMHSFTPDYEGEIRRMEVGVLFNHHEPPARRLAAHLDGAGWAVALNEPWSGREGLMYAADRHSGVHGRVALEIEVRQDLLLKPEALRRLARDLVGFFEPGAR
ncbi:MAG: N-formylglutamate amidohydrolase [Myxococcota bacterium]